MTRPRGLAAVLAPPVLVLAIAIAGLEGWLRVERFGAVALRRPLDYMTPKWRVSDCLKGDPVSGFMMPNCRVRQQGAVVAFNSMGLNDREVNEAAPHYRVLVLGDSLTVATGVEQVDWPSFVEARYARDLGAPRFVEFYNAARAGRTLARELRDLDQALSRWPLDAVLVGLSPSDLWEGVQESDSCGPGHDELLLGRDDLRLYNRSVRGRNWLTRLVGDLEGVTGLWTVNRLRDLLRRLVRWRNQSEESQRRMLELERNAVAAFRLCARQLRAEADRAGLELAWAVVWYAPDRHGEILVDVLLALGEPVLSLMDVYRDVADPGVLAIYAGDSHPSAVSHHLFAERIYPWLGEIGWTKRIKAAHGERTGSPPAELNPRGAGGVRRVTRPGAGSRPQSVRPIIPRNPQPVGRLRRAWNSSSCAVQHGRRPSRRETCYKHRNDAAGLSVATAFGSADPSVSPGRRRRTRSPFQCLGPVGHARALRATARGVAPSICTASAA